jgi:hypothetical protein
VSQTPKIHQSLDVDRHFTAKITLNRQPTDLFPEALEISVGKVLDLAIKGYATVDTELLCGGSTHTIDRSESDLSVLMRRNINTSDTCHGFPLIIYVRPELTLALLVSWIGTDHPNDTFTPNDLTVTAHLLNRSSNFHQILQGPEGPRFTYLPVPRTNTSLLCSKYDPRATQIIGRQFNRDLVPWQDADVVHPHFSRNMAKDYMSILELYPKRSIRKIFKNLPLHLNYIIFRHAAQTLFQVSDHPPTAGVLNQA